MISHVRIARSALCIASLAAAFAVAAAGDPSAGKAKAAACMACHGPDGNSVSAEWPKLAGQNPAYIVKQLGDFKSGRRVNQVMSPMAQPLGAKDIEDIAAYFATGTPQPATGTAASMATGRQIYEGGRHRPAVIACKGCHSPNGAGNGNVAKMMAAPMAVIAPAIGSQHAAYVLRQLKAYRSGQRTNDVGRIMGEIASRLTEEEMAAVAEYVATLQR